MISIAALRAMAAAGCSLDQVLDALDAENKIAEEKQARVREQTRQRVAKLRGRAKQEEIERAKRMGGKGIPKGWRPNMDGLMRMDMMGLNKAQADLEIERFRDYYLAHGHERVDWNAAFRSWLNSPWFAKGQSNGRPKEHYLGLWDAAYAKLEAAAARGGDGLRPPPAAPVHPKVRR